MSQTYILPSEKLKISLELYKNVTSQNDKANVAIVVAERYFDINQYNNALNFAAIAKAEADKVKSVKNSVLSYIISGKCYVELGLYDLAKKAFYDGLSLVNNDINKSESFVLKAMIYNGLANSYSEPSKKKIFFEKNHEELKQQKDGSVKRDLMNIFNAGFGNYYYDNANNSLAKYYYKQVDIVDSEEWKTPQFKAMLGLGHIYALENEYVKAVNCLEKGLSKALMYRNRKAQRDFNLALFKNSKTKEEQYFLNYSFLNDSLQKQEDLDIKKVIEKEVNKVKKSQQYLMGKIILVSGISIIIVILGLVTGLTIFKNHKEHKINKAELDKSLFNKKVLLVGEPVDTKHEVDVFLKLVKNNDLADLANKMKLLYPDFVEKLSIHLLKPSSGELVLSVLVRMNFTNKEIAEVLGTSLRSVESRKYRLRKKINLSSEKDMNLWMINL